MKEETNMSMTYELITPEMAADLLETNENNRTISSGTVTAYMNDMLAGNWDETVGVAISIDEDGNLRDGQHRLMAIAKSGVPIRMWVCRNVSSYGIYDNNRKRRASDQIMIMRSDFEAIYRSTRYIGVARAIIMINDHTRRTVTPKEIIDFTESNKELLDGFFLNIDQSTAPKISLSVVHLAMFTAYLANVSIDDIVQYYEILRTGMATNAEEHPIIAYRNYLKERTKAPDTTLMEVARCQYSIKKYLTKSCTKRTIAPKELVYPFPEIH